jgi:glycyl-tRNA synthetase
MVDCKSSKLRFRADQVFWAKVETTSDVEVGYVSLLETVDMEREASKAAQNLAKKLGVFLLL